MATSATFVIDYGSVEDAYLVAELDEERNGGKTSFSRGDTVHFRIYSDVNYTIETTSGTIQNGNIDEPEEMEAEVLSFVKGQAPSVTKKVVTMGVTTWYGNDLGAINSIGSTTVQADNADEDTLGIASIEYTSEYNQHSLVPPGTMTETWHILVYVLAVL